MNAGLVWMTVGIVICGAELLHPGVFLLWIGLAALAAGAITRACDLVLIWQIGAFTIALAALLCIAYLRRRRRPTEGGVNASDAGLIGQTCRAMGFRGNEGRVAFRDGVWPARMTQGSGPAPDTVLRVTGLDGTTLLVTID